jgi:hypothetical protein
MHNCKEFGAMANAVLTESIEAQAQGLGSPYLGACGLDLGLLMLGRGFIWFWFWLGGGALANN